MCERSALTQEPLILLVPPPNFAQMEALQEEIERLRQENEKLLKEKDRGV